LAVLTQQGQFIESCGCVVWPDETLAASYRFRHDLYREILYEEIPPSRQRQWHLQIGARKERGYGERAREIAAELAVHFVRGCAYDRAVPYLYYAGENALQRGAYQEAVTHLTAGLEVLATLPETPTRAYDELRLQRTLGASLVATHGFGAVEVERAYARAQEICQQRGDTQQIFPVLFGLWGVYDVRPNAQRAREVAEQFLTLAQRQADPALLVLAYRALGETLSHLGEVVPARAYLEQGLALYNPQQQRTQALLYGHDAGISCLGFVARALWILGYPDQALHRSREALALAQTLSHPFSLAFALILTITLHHLRREVQTVLAQTETLTTLSTKQGFPQGVANGMWYRGWALTMHGHMDEGITLIRQGEAAHRALGIEVSRPYMLAVLADALGKAGDVDNGLRVLTEALALVERRGTRVYEAELYRIKGELLLAQAAAYAAATCFQQALAIARHQQARSWELRTAMSLCRLWRQQGKRAEARELLAPVYSWFTEGFDTPDLQEAKTLLDELEG
jgi:predicted ATPase